MACGSEPVQNRRSFSERKAEVKDVVDRIKRALVSGKVQALVDRDSGAVAFLGAIGERAKVADACVYREIMRTGTAAEKMVIVKAEQKAGRRVSTEALRAGFHSHDGIHFATHKH